MRSGFHGLFAAGLLLVSAPHVVAGEDEAALRSEALALNDFLMLGNDDRQQLKAVDDKVQELKKDAGHAKKLLATATTLATDSDQTFTYAATFLLGSLAKDRRDVDAGQLFFGQCLEKAKKLQSGHKLAQVYPELIALLSKAGKYAEAEKACREFLSVQGDAYVTIQKERYARPLVGQLIALQGRVDEALALLDSQLREQGYRVQLLLTQAWVLQFDGQYKEAARIYEGILQALKSDEEKAILHLDLGNLYSEAGDVDKATTHLKWLLDRQPDDPRLNNALGYAWAEADRNLDDAEKMIRKALDKEPNTPAYVDSLGWVLFKQAKYAEAKECFLKAIRDPDGRHAEIYDHLAQTHMALGEKEDGISAWKKALEVAGPSKREQQRKTDIEKKLKEQQP